MFPQNLRGIQKNAVEVMRTIQRSVLCSAVRILRRPPSVEGLAPGRKSVYSPVPVQVCCSLKGSGAMVYGGKTSYYNGQLWPNVQLTTSV